MLEQITQLVKQYGQQAIVDNPEVPNDLNNQVMAEAANTITGGLQNILSGGGLQGLLGLFGGNQNQSRGGILSNPIVAMMVGHLANKLVQKMGLDPSLANNISNNIIPNVLNNITQRTVSDAPQDNGFDLNDLVGALTGGGGQQASGGGLDLQDLLRQFTQGGQANVDANVEAQITRQAQNQNQGGGLADLIGGFFK